MDLLEGALESPGRHHLRCAACSIPLSSARKLVNHLVSKHFKGSPFPCPGCAQTLLSARQLLQHLREHAAEGLHACPRCRRSFATAGALQRHALQARQRCGGDHACAQCERSFASAAGLRRHERVHERRSGVGQRGQACRCTCGARFARTADMYAHERTAHERFRDHACERCERAFTSAARLRGHVLRAHEPAGRSGQARPARRAAAARGEDERPGPDSGVLGAPTPTSSESDVLGASAGCAEDQTASESPTCDSTFVAPTRNGCDDLGAPSGDVTENTNSSECPSLCCSATSTGSKGDAIASPADDVVTDEIASDCLDRTGIHTPETNEVLDGSSKAISSSQSLDPKTSGMSTRGDWNVSDDKTPADAKADVGPSESVPPTPPPSPPPTTSSLVDAGSSLAPSSGTSAVGPSEDGLQATPPWRCAECGARFEDDFLLLKHLSRHLHINVGAGAAADQPLWYCEW